jgi:hypothetical protein
VLPPDHRVVLLDQLQPPPGYQLDAAVATTFTLGLSAALVPPLAFAGLALRNTPDPVSALAAVRACADKVDVFCQAGMIGVPTRHSDLFAFAEPMVHEVAPPPGRIFHPKLWLLRYSSAGLEDAYRLVVLSRNLTDDHAWDVALRLDGVHRGGPHAGNAPLAHLLRDAADRVVVPLPEDRRARVEALAEDARRVEWELPGDVRQLALHAFGVPGRPAAPDFSGYRHLVVSPFLDEEGLQTVTPSTRKATLISRPEAMDRLDPASLDRLEDTYIVSSLGALSQTDADDLDVDAAPPAPLLAGLHAKLYVVERNRTAHVFLGSANATHAAFGGNVELLVELVGSATKLGVDQVLSDGTGMQRLLEPYAAVGGAEPDPADEIRRLLDNALRALGSLSWTVTVKAAGGGDHRLRVTTHRPVVLDGSLATKVELLTRPGTAVLLDPGASVEATFDGVALADITPFVAVRVRHEDGAGAAAVVRGRLVGDPAGRLDEVLARQVDTPEKFLRFLALLLGLGEGHPLATLVGTGAGAGDGARLGSAPGVFETVLRALARKPDAIDDLDRLVTRMLGTETGRAALPEGFQDFWAVVVEGRAAVREATR